MHGIKGKKRTKEMEGDEKEQNETKKIREVKVGRGYKSMEERERILKRKMGKKGKG